MKKNSISYNNKGFIINGKQEYLIGGEFHYFRVPSYHWEDRLKKMKNMGANLISVYIPWGIHEPEEGKLRWSGDYDLERFLSLCQEYGFYVLIKPGPYVCAELDFGGHPDWLIKKIIEDGMKLRMLDEKYLEECKRWYKIVSEKINRFLITNGGNIVAIQIENEYDHLIEYGEDTITEKDAIDYFMYLRNIMDEYGIDIPKFANEAAFLRGSGIIDTRTYYPNIPGLWMWEFDLFENKIIQSKKEQPDCPIMILELQAGWFAQVGVPIYNPDINVVRSVTKSVMIQGASVINYYMLVGGTTFPFMGARGDICFFGGLGNITSYDFGKSPIRESGEINEEKYYFIKGMIRFAKQFSNIILESDHKSFVNIISGGDDIAVIKSAEIINDSNLMNSNENFMTYEEGNEEGRFFFIRNLEKEGKNLTIKITKELLGRELVFEAYIAEKSTKMFPINFLIPDSDLRINYSTSEILLSKKVENKNILVMYGEKNSNGELCIDVPTDEIELREGNMTIENRKEYTIVKYKHSDINIMKINDVYIFIIEEDCIGKIEEIENGLLLHDLYYIEKLKEIKGEIYIKAQVKEKNNKIKVFEFDNQYKSREVLIDTYFDEFDEKNQYRWTSNWRYKEDTDEIKNNYITDNWELLNDPKSLEALGMFEHGYYWYRTEFELENDVEECFISYKHNYTDRMFIYINEKLVYKSINKPIENIDISAVIKKGQNTMVILYANEFHNKSHPHEGELVKYSGILNDIILTGVYNNQKEINIMLSSFYVKKGLSGKNKGYHTLEYDDCNWSVIKSGNKFVVGKELGDVGWFRRTFKYYKNDLFNAPLLLKIKEADEILTIYINGMPLGRYDIKGPQDEFFIPEAYLNTESDNVISIILEAPGFYNELQSGYRRGYMYSPEIKFAYVSKNQRIII